MDKRYQVFVSSTYNDLKVERQKVTQTLMEMDCIPAGMELFPAVDEEQWEFIKKIIKDCDYYLLIIGAKYGSTTSDGISYTEKEYDYAVEIGLKIVALIHGNPENIAPEKSEVEPELAEKLKTFRNKVSTGRMVKFWENSDDLAGKVALSMQKTIKMFPAVGWTRAGGPSSEKLLQEINEVRKENSKLKKEIQNFVESQPNLKITNLADLDETYSVNGSHRKYRRGQIQREEWEVSVTWRQIFSDISPYLSQHPNQDIVKQKLKDSLYSRLNDNGTDVTLNDQDFQTIAIQLKALGLVSIKYLKTVGGSMAWFWHLTQNGEQLMLNERAIKTAKNLIRS